jgi:hypothetical protein
MSTQTARYNPAPGWPVPPPGWQPPANFTPDPAWGPAPEGWQVWVPVTPPAYTTAAVLPTGVGRSNNHKTLKIVLGGIALFILLMIVIGSASGSKSGSPTASTPGTIGNSEQLSASIQENVNAAMANPSDPRYRPGVTVKLQCIPMNQTQYTCNGVGSDGTRSTVTATVGQDGSWITSNG